MSWQSSLTNDMPTSFPSPHKEKAMLIYRKSVIRKT